MNNAKPIAIAGVAVVAIIALMSAVYVVDETQQVIITQFGEPVGQPVTNPGLHFKIPFTQDANYFDKRFLEWDGSPNQIPTKDKRFIWVDSYARWRISDHCFSSSGSATSGVRNRGWMTFLTARPAMPLPATISSKSCARQIGIRPAFRRKPKRLPFLNKSNWAATQSLARSSRQPPPE